MIKYLHNHNLNHLYKLSQVLNQDLTFIDLETTGMVHESNFALIEIGLINISHDRHEEKNSLINPKMKIPKYISEITNIYDHMVQDKPEFSHFAKYIYDISQKNILCGFNSKTFDSKGLEKMLILHNFSAKFSNQLDFRHVFLRSRKFFDNISGQHGSLTQACNHHNINLPKGIAHRAGYDIAITALLAEELLRKHGFGIINKEIEKFANKESKERYYKHIVQEKIYPIF